MKLLSCEKAASEIIGHVIILSITIIGISMITLYGVPAIYTLQDTANVRNVEQAFTVLDSRASRAILGESPLQITNINLGGGTLLIEPNSTGKESYMVIKSQNGTFVPITIPMGRLKYQLEDRIVAYEGGGVWSKYPTGSLMISPPEFHYNGVTLTLPVINISGSTSTGGKGVTGVFFRRNAPVVLYPNSNFANRTNPVNGNISGKIYVNITSDFYDAWADYARGLGYTKVTENSSKREAGIELTIVPSTLGGITSVPDPITIRGLDPSNQTPLSNFSFRIETPTSGNLNWDIRTKSGNKRLIFYLDEVSGNKVDLYIGYQDDGQGYDDPAETWKGIGNFTVEADGYVNVDLLNSSINLTYTGAPDIGTTSSCSDTTKIRKSDFNETDFSWDGVEINENDYKSLYAITQHYIWKMAQDGDISFEQCSPSGKGPAGGSTMLINYRASGALSYMHISENRADVSIS